MFSSALLWLWLWAECPPFPVVSSQSLASDLSQCIDGLHADAIFCYLKQPRRVSDRRVDTCLAVYIIQEEEG